MKIHSTKKPAGELQIRNGNHKKLTPCHAIQERHAKALSDLLRSYNGKPILGKKYQRALLGARKIQIMGIRDFFYGESEGKIRTKMNKEKKKRLFSSIKEKKMTAQNNKGAEKDL